ncbi:uncharacterized protein Z520_07732 [Fonsecaea multimorphosa CBS 102226]|uniref:DNA polymerase epsilon subunit B n=1 Tax=Fonsecaea multimorphosa CBS 102226 TaxID=1442371 RepID=A0A0D2IHG9_9EURO|nr:uncharacterized protein Z520_07732 [Fonsecaea multimorphosa CBS 102226]KIX96466.1 hypothetical protein Z520_07732 [Fonsecaea multimorphosa CBS 102226]OAL28333.1 hypothetical protein AYO22_03039 [Fonsecaea multimorphosa]
MEEPISTPGLPTRTYKARSDLRAEEQLLSSSPGFGTPAYPIKPRQTEVAKPFAAQLNTSTTTHSAPTVLPILLPPQTLRPVAFRTLTKKHNLTLTSSGLGLLSTFIGKFCGSGWREEGLAERVLDEIAKAWKKCGGGLLVEDGPEKKLSSILKSLEPCMSGGRLDTGKLSRSNSSVPSPNLSRASSFTTGRPDANTDVSQSSLGPSAVNVEDGESRDRAEEEEQSLLDVRSYLKVIPAFDQPRLMYSTSSKSLEPVKGAASLLPPIQHKISMFRNHYHLVHQRLMRNESFQTPSFATTARPPRLMHSASGMTTMQQAYKITPIANLLGRSGTSHLLLGMLVHSPAGDVALTDLSGSVILELSIARPVPEDGVWFCPGMLILVEGTYEEDGSHNSNLGSAAGVGGQIKGVFVAHTLAGPPAERRALSLGISNGLDSGGNTHASMGAGFGWIDFLGVGSEKALGNQMRRIQRRIFRPPTPSQTLDVPDEDEIESEPPRRQIALLGECNLDSPRTLEAIRAILSSYNASSAGHISDLPFTIVMMGNFISAAAMSGSSKGGGSIEYKEHFDALASILSEFPLLLATTTFVFVPGDNDPWVSSFSAGASCLLPRQGIPEVFTSRVRRAFTAANAEVHGGLKEKDGLRGESIWATNPARMSLFGPLEEIVMFRDDITSRFRRTALTFPKLDTDEEESGGGAAAANVQDQDQDPPQSDVEEMDLDDHPRKNLDRAVHSATSHVPSSGPARPSLQAARKLVKTILDQSHLSPFPLSIRPQLWDHSGALSLYPLPTALVLCDAEMPAFAISYEGCHVMNVGRLVDEFSLRRGGQAGVARGSGFARWIEYDCRSRKGEERTLRF